jgi:3-hydroxyisobutyrate dehydrogenase-like beta-hydroxyacid dehydrogenase
MIPRALFPSQSTRTGLCLLSRGMAGIASLVAMIAFLGLGRMGAPIAGRLLAAGHDLVVWNRTVARAEPLAAAGAKVAATPAEAVTDADIVITMLADPPALQAVAAQIAPAMRPDAILIDMSTVGPAAVRALAERVPALVDAPVMGSVDRAVNGTLTVLAGGDVDRVDGILATFGTVVRCGEVGAGAARKILLINAAIGGVTLVADLVALGDELGIPDPLEVLAEGPLSASVTRVRSAGSNFPIKLAAKDVGLALQEGQLPVLAAIRERLLAVPTQEADLRGVVH